MKFLKYLLLLLLCCSFFFVASSQQNSWSQWRGGNYQGVSPWDSLPTTWSDTSNVLWSTEIQGLGHSSPVYEGDNLIVTTAYFTPKYKKLLLLNQILIPIVLVLIAFLFFRHLQFLINCKPNLSQILPIISFCFILGIVVHFALLGFVFNTPEKSDHITQAYRWFYSSSIVLLVLSLANLLNQSKRSKKIFLLVILIVLIISVFLRPNSHYYSLFEASFFSETIYKTIAIASVIILLFVLRKPMLKIHFKWPLFFVPKLIVWFATLAAFVCGLLAIQLYRFILYHMPAGIFSFPDIDLYYRDGIIYFRILFFALLLVYVSLLSIKKEFLIKSRFLFILLIILGIIIFSEKNILSNQKTYVRAVLCLNKHTGEIKWTKELFPGDQPTIHLDNSPATPTPIIKNDTIYAYFGTPGLVCLDIKGKIIWENTDLPFEGIHGIGGSPTLHNNQLVIINDMAEWSYITAIDTKTGQRNWTKERPAQGGTICTFRTPTICVKNDTGIVVTWAKDNMILYNIIDGSELSNINLKSSHRGLVSTIMHKNDTLFCNDIKYNYALSLDSLLSGKNPIIWELDLKNKGPKDVSSVIFDNYLFAVSDNGFVTCINTVNGDIIWQERLKGIYMSSCMLTNNNIYISSTNGYTSIIKAKNEFELIAKNKLADPIYASIAPDKGRIYLRTTTHLFSIKYHSVY